MTHIVDNVYLASCADMANFTGMNKCDDLAIIVGDNLNNTIPIAVFYLMTKYGQTYETSRNYVVTKLDAQWNDSRFGTQYASHSEYFTPQ